MTRPLPDILQSAHDLITTVGMELNQIFDDLTEQLDKIGTDE